MKIKNSINKENFVSPDAFSLDCLLEQTILEGSVNPDATLENFESVTDYFNN